jgi:hypothetical protein
MSLKDNVNELLKKVGLKAEEIALETVTVDDGAATLEAEMFEAGNAVFIVNEDERIPLPVGEYLLDDGRTLVVTEEGMIAEVREAGAEEEAPAEEEEAVAASEGETKETPLPKAIIESVVKETKFSAEEELINSMKEEITALKAELEELKQPKEEVKEEVELSEEVEEPKPIVHNPEKEGTKVNFKIHSKKGRTQMDRVLQYINKK